MRDPLARGPWAAASRVLRHLVTGRSRAYPQPAGVVPPLKLITPVGPPTDFGDLKGLAKVKEASDRLITGVSNRDYEDCLHAGEVLFEIMPDYMIFHMVLLALFRLDREVAGIEKYVDRMRPRIDLTPWQEVLVQITSGMRPDITNLLTAPDITDEQRCQLCYYMGCRMVYVGLADTANTLFGICAVADAKGLEKSLAMSECETRGITVNDSASGRFFHGSPQRQAAMRRNDAAGALLKKRQHAEALPLAQRGLVLALQDLGENHIATADSHNILGTALQGLDRLRDGLPHFEAAHRIQRRVLGVRNPDVMNSLNHLSEVHRALGDNAAASRCLEEILQVRRRWKA